VATRIRAWAASFIDREDPAEFTVAVTHSPVLRAVAVAATGSDPGEPEWLAGLEAEIDPDRSVRFTLLPTAPGGGRPRSADLIPAGPPSRCSVREEPLR
jgi:hypothetical protein